ncbi:MAG: ABC transporter ATP-binding protein [Candidatus Pseudobacter hemicellulosilyticus]|uniref:ABC transporter ATP-binding protein n=1 Tax=Candidatus Pseudobacter hemicellulosilyticus TaxID=3121375 RepID=A0AAJ5WVU6_9BACT|nr:MAG: ABC transporter ATP-binding protein [Pseudobacter sp.]
MSNAIIKVENLSKQYRLGKIGTGSLAHDVNRWWYQIRGKEDPYLKIGATNDRTSKDDSEYVWSLRDISFDINQGDAVGIIGRNGAGKSTLLKILSRTTQPTIGRIKIKGRVASLLEVGTGFHPELTGRENVYLNGAILGMTKKEIARKFDEIISFAGVEKYVDTPVKRYSSGMYVRLAFGVAAHLEPDILIVDEVLAVGDSEFQKKALGKMQDVTKSEGRTVLFVSHNMAAVSSLCNKSIVMVNGGLAFTGSVNKGIEYYLNAGNKASDAVYTNEQPNKTDILSIRILRENVVEPTQVFKFKEKILLEFTVQSALQHQNIVLRFRLKDQKERNIFSSQVKLSDYTAGPGDKHVFTVEIPGGILVPNAYFPVVALHVPNTEMLRLLEAPVSFEIEDTGSEFYQDAGSDYGCVMIDCKWKYSHQ